jgi:hypothetical protein
MRRIELFRAWIPWCMRTGYRHGYYQADRVRDMCITFKRKEVALL